MSDGAKDHGGGDGLVVRLAQPTPTCAAEGDVPSLAPQSVVIITGSNATGESMLVRPILGFLRGGWAEPSLPAGPQFVGPGQSVSFRLTLPARPVERIGLQQLVASGDGKGKPRVLHASLAPNAGGTWHPFDLEDVGWITVGALFYAFAVRGLTQFAFDVGSAALWFVVLLALAVVVLYAALTRFYRRLMVWSREGVPVSSSAARAGELVIMASGITYLAVAVSSLMLNHGLLEASPAPGNGVEVVEGLELFFGLSLLGTIPALRIPETFNLEAPVQYEGLAMGLLVTVYRLALLLPAAALVVSLFNDFRFWPTRGGQAEVVDVEKG